MASVKFYGKDQRTGKRRVFTFFVHNLSDAETALIRMNQKTGFFVNDAGGSKQITAKDNREKHHNIFKKMGLK